MASYDAVVVGAGPNGLCAAATLARAGRSVLLVEAADRVGGGCRSLALTEPGFVHDVCSSIHPLAAFSPALRSLRLEEEAGLVWVQPEVPLAHPFDDRPAALLRRSLAQTARELDEDERAWTALLRPAQLALRSLSEPAEALGPGQVLRALGRGLGLSRSALSSASSLVRARFDGEDARALFAGLAAHSLLPLERRPSGGFGLALAALAHVVGWPFPRGGAQALADAIARVVQQAGGVIQTGWRVRSLDELPRARAYLLDLPPRAVAEVAGPRLPHSFCERLLRYRHGPGACKVDYALSAPIPWRDPRCCLAGTVHLGASLREIEASERAPWEGRVCPQPFVLVVQTSLFDDSRAPAGAHTAWAYCHVPAGSDDDATPYIEAQLERFAPGFRALVRGKHVFTARGLEEHNPSYVGGDINHGVLDLAQLLTRPTWRAWATPAPDVWICSAATPPGGGVHGLCGYAAARAALSSRRLT